MRRSILRGAATFLLIVAVTQILGAASSAVNNRRARPPKWIKSVTDVFFADAREKLVGTRPADSDRGVATTSAGGPASSTPAGGGPAPAGGSFAWSKLISSDTIEQEIKTQQGKVVENVQTPSKWKGGGYKDGRNQFSVLATMFGIISEYDGDVRWKKEAAGMRDLVGRAGHNCKVGTDASFNEAKVRKDDLENLVRGGSPDLPNAEPAAKWEKVTDRPPLMARLEQAQQQGVAIWTANAGDFSKNAEQLLHEAQVLAAISEVIQREGFEFADDNTYLGFAQKMRQGAIEVAEAVKTKNYDQARKASGDIDKACSSCHEGYRS